MPLSIECPRCGAKNEYRARRCSVCGAFMHRGLEELPQRGGRVGFFPVGCLPFIILLIALLLFLFYGKL